MFGSKHTKTTTIVAREAQFENTPRAVGDR